MKVYYISRKLGILLNSDAKLKKEFGKKMTRKIQQRLLELNAATNLNEISYLPPPRCHELTNDRKGQFSVDLEQPMRLIFIPANDPIPLKEDGGYDLNKITEIEIIEICDTHDGKKRR